jgi:hypothetical protein
VMK